MMAATVLPLDSRFFVLLHLPTCGTGPLPFSVRVLAGNSMTAGILAPSLLSERRVMRTSWPHRPGNSHREPVTRPRIKTGLVGQQLRIRASQGLPLPR